MARNSGPFPVYRMQVGQAQPGNANDRTFHPNGVDGMTGPSYSNRRGNTDVIPVSGGVKPVRRFGVASCNRGEWKR